MAMEHPLVQIPEEARPDLGEAQGRDASEVACHTTGFAGSLLLLDNIVFWASCVLHVLVAVFLLVGHAYIWFGTLSTIFLIAIADGVVLRCCGRVVLMRDRSIRRFMYGIPLAFFCFYSSSLIRMRDQSACPWHITVNNDNLLVSTKAGTYIAGVVVLLSMALAALRMDCNSSAHVSWRVRQSHWYVPCHVLVRATELSFRLGAGVFLCECLRMQPWAIQTSHRVFLCLPFFCLVFVYSLVLQAANTSGGKPRDDPIASVVAGVITLAMNPMHFFARPGYDAVVWKANKSLFMIRVLEVVVAVGFVYHTAIRVTTPKDQCGHAQLKGIDIIRALGPLPMYQVVVSLAVHYLIMALHRDIQHSTCQALTHDETGGGARAQISFRRPGQESLQVPPPPAAAGLGRAWVQVGGGLPLTPLAEERPAEELEAYQIRKVLGGGGFGVVVQVERLPQRRGRAPRAYAMKLLNTSDLQHRRLARREATIYSNIWLEMRELAPGCHRVGHPNIVQLQFWTVYDQGRHFYMNTDGEDEIVQHPKTCSTTFHMALMMELCEMNLTDYLEAHHGSTAEWFATAVHLLSEVQLALSFLHSINLAYRDLKPDNVLIVRRPGSSRGLPHVHCKLGDFGYSRVVDPLGLHKGSVAGSAYFCAPEMEERYLYKKPLDMTQAEENALDTYSFGTVCFVLAVGPHYNQEIDPDKMGPRIDHPVCHKRDAPARCGQCTGCRLLEERCRQLLPLDPNAQLTDLIGRCVERSAARRPAVAALQADALFRGVDFDALVRLEI